MLLVEGALEEPLGIEQEGGGRVRVRFSLIATDEGCGGLNLCETQTSKDHFHSREDGVFDLGADLGHVVSVEAFAGLDVDLEAVAHVHQNNLTRSLRLVERDNIVTQALQGSIVSSAQLPVIHDQETGDGSTEAAERDTVVGELDHQWGEVPGDFLVGNG